MQNLGYDVLKYFKLGGNNLDRAELSTKEQMLRGAKEIKMLISSCYQYYTAHEDINELLRTPNPFYECLLDQVIPAETETDFLSHLKDCNFAKAHGKLTQATFNFNQKRPPIIDRQVQKFVQYGIHCKFFMLSLAMSLNLRCQSDPVLQS